MIGVICLSAFCFFLGKVTRYRLWDREEEFIGPLHPNINQNEQQEGQQEDILNQQQEPNNLQF